jgi:purine-binding chemotaxis protein CheW
MSNPRLPNIPEQLVVFRVGKACYGLDIAIVEEILAEGDVTTVPDAPAGVLGVARVRNNVVSVFDLFWKFGADEPTMGQETCLIMVHHRDGTVALRVGVVEEVVSLPGDAYQNVRAPGQPSSLSYLRGVAQWGDELVLWIDPEPIIPALAATLARAA